VALDTSRRGRARRPGAVPVPRGPLSSHAPSPTRRKATRIRAPAKAIVRAEGVRRPFGSGGGPRATRIGRVRERELPVPSQSAERPGARIPSYGQPVL
jgi:hypothetical protein